MNGKLLLKQTAKWRVLYVAALLASLSFFGVNALDTYEPTVVSDKDDYAPGEVAVITGYGWTKDSLVDIHLEEDPAHDHHHGYHDTKVNADGTWRIEYPIEERHLGVKFTVLVEGKQTGTKASTYFTDANVSFNASGLPNGVRVIVRHAYTAAANGTALDSSTFTTPNSSAAIASANNREVLFSYPRTIAVGTKNYLITNVAASNSGTINTSSGNYDYSFTSPSQARTITATYKKATAVTVAAVTGVQGGNVTLSASLKESGANLIGKTIRFTFNNATLTAQTNNGGNASVTVSLGSLAVGNHSYTAEFAEDAEFAGSSATGTVTVNPACTAPAISAQPGNQNLIFGDNASFTVTASGTAPYTYQWQVNSGAGFTNVSGATSATLTLTNPTVSLSGSEYRCVVTNSCGSVTSNAATLHVQKAPAKVTLADLEHTYNGSAKSATATTDATGTSSFTFTYDGAGTQPVDHKEDGYNVVATLVNDNYYGSATGKLMINKADQVIAWTAPASIEYGTLLTASQLNASLTTGDGGLTYTPAVGELLNAGTFSLKVTAAATNNYKAAEATVSIEVTKATPTVAIITGGPYTYDGTAKSISGATVTGVGGANLGAASLTYKHGETTVAAPTNAGTYTVLASFAGNDNYNSAEATATVVIEKAGATLAFGQFSHTYDGTAKVATVTTTPAYLSGISLTYDGSSTAPAKANKYTVVATLANDNYKLVNMQGNEVASITDELVIVPKVVTASVLVGAKIYDGTASADITSYSLSGIINGDKVDLTGGTAEFSDKNVASAKVVTVSGLELSGADAGNYVLESATVTTVSDITAYSVMAKIFAQDKEYDGTVRAEIIYPLGGFIGIDDVAFAFGEASFDNSNVGQNKPVTVSVSLTGEDAGNYALISDKASTTAAITPRYVTVVATEGQRKVFGTSDPVFSYSIQLGSLVGKDGFSGALRRAAGENVGEYALNVGTLSLGDNYSLSLAEGAIFAITPRSISVTPTADQSKVYGSTDPIFSYTSSELVGADTFSGALSREPGSNVGSYSITQGTLALSRNYTLDFVEGVKFEITPKSLVASISAEDKVYDGNINATASGSVPAADVVGNDIVGVAVTNAVFDDKNAGTDKTVTAAVAISNGNYSLSNSSASTTANISPKPITGAFAANDKVYDGTTAATVAGLNLVGVVDKDEVALNGGVATFADKNVATGKTVTLAEAELTGADKDNYSLTQVATALAAISPKPASVTAVANSKVYGTDDPVLTGSVDGFIGADGIAATFTRAVGEAVGNYLITATLSPADALSNYSITYHAADIEITKAALSVTADNKDRIYGDANPTFTGIVTGVVAGDVITADYTSVATTTSPVGTYSIIPALSGDALKNYELTVVNGTLTVDKAPLTAVANNKTRIYGIDNPTLNGVLTGVKNNDQISASYNTAADALSDIGEYLITVTLNDPDSKLGNYEVSTANGKLTITQAPATIALAGLSKVYNGKGQGAEVTTSPEGLALTVTYAGESALPKAAGSYAVVATLNNSNYAADNATGTLVIAPKGVTAALAHAGKVYDGTTTAPGTTATLDGVIGEDDVTAVVTDAAFDSAAAGDRTVRATVTLSGNDKDNYVLGNVSDANATITPKAVTAGITATDKVYDGNTAASATGSVSAAEVVAGDEVEVTVSNANFADKHVGTGKVVTATVSINNSNYSLSSGTATTTASITAKGLTASISASDKVYDGNKDAAVVATLTDGLVAGDDVAVIASEGLFDTKNVGVDKPVTAAIIISGKDAQNYLVNKTASTTASITAKPISVTADAKSKTYGDPDPALTYSTAPGTLVPGDGFTGSLSRVAGENVGAYAIEQNTLTAGSNYALTFVSANLTINPRAIEVTADAKQKMAGQLDPALTYKVTSGTLVLGDTFSGALERDGGEAAGEYAINQGSLSAGTNYSLTYKGAKLTIYAIPTVSIDNPAPVQYSTGVTVSASYTGIVTNPVWDWGFTANTNGVQTATSITGSTTAPSSPGVYTLVLKYKNAVGDELTTAPVFLSVYDPEGGFVTGGGWINSPAGALDGSNVTGKANFGFVAKYKKGKNEVEGNTEFQFQAGNINFKSAAHNAGSLVISGAKATYKGTGTIAGLSGTYEFMVVATDGQVSGGGGNDKFRIKIWNGGNVIYDNARGQLENAELGDNAILGGGSIVIHEVKAVATGPKTNKVISEELAAESTARFDNYPNAFSDRTTIRFSFDTEQSFALEVYDIRGALLKKVATGVAESGQVYEYELDGRNLAEGVYFGRLATGAGVKTIKMLLKK